MTIVRIVLADPRTGRPPRGGGVNGPLRIVLADDTGHRAVPVWVALSKMVDQAISFQVTISLHGGDSPTQ